MNIERQHTKQQGRYAIGCFLLFTPLTIFFFWLGTQAHFGFFVGAILSFTLSVNVVQILSKNLTWAHTVLHAMPDDMVFKELRSRADHVLRAEDKLLECKKDRTCTDANLAYAQKDAVVKEEDFWVLHNALQGLGFKLNPRIVDYASRT